MVTELEESFSLSFIRIVEGEAVFNKFVKSQGPKIPGLTPEQEKLLAVCRKEKEDKTRKQFKELKAQ